MKKVSKHLSIFAKAFKNMSHEILISLGIVLLLTFALAWIFYVAEHSVQPDVFSSWIDAVVWGYTRYIEGGDGVFDGGPITVVGRIIAFLLGFIGIAIVAIPAGLLGSGFIDAMADEKREEELKSYHRQMRRAFKAAPGRLFRQYIEKLPKDEKAWYSGCNFGYINNNVNVTRFQLKGMELKDILDVCKEYPEFRVKNEASAMSIEEGKEDRYMLETYPVNRRYGYFVNRGSKVIIVSTSSHSELCIGNFSYYLAKFAGFNYISKDFNAADGESYYNNHWKDPFYEGVTLQERLEKGEKVGKELRKSYEQKAKLREEFLSDLESLAKVEGSWIICLLSHVPNQNSQVDIHVSHSLSDGSCSTILSDQSKYDELVKTMNSNLQEELQLSVEETDLFPLVKRGTFRNLAYKLHDDGCRCNVFTLRVSSHLMEFDTRMRVAQFILSKTIHDVLEPEHRLLPKEIEDMNRTSRFYGFADQEIEKVKDKLFESE